MYHAGKFEWSAMLKTWDDSLKFQDNEHMVLGMKPLAYQVRIEKTQQDGWVCE